MTKPKKTEELLKFSYNRISGEMLGDIPSNESLQSLIDVGLVSEINTGNAKIYFLNPYSTKFVTIEPNGTLLKMFEKVIYCSNATCGKYGKYDETHKDCNECIHRIPSTVEELYEKPSYVLLNDNYEEMIFLSEDDEPKEKRLTYWKYLATDYWKGFREEVFLHYGRKCGWCGAEGEEVSFNIHHERYGAWFHEEIDNVIPLCSTCHSKAHGKG